MIAALQFMIAPFIACLLLIGINIYFGIHVIKREIIFIDIALAQIAALGGTIAAVLQMSHSEGVHHHDEQSLFVYLFSIGFTTIAAALFAFIKNKKLNIPLESLIGIAYAVAATGAVVILDKAAGGDVHVHEMFAGSILWVSWQQNLYLFLAFAVIGLFHFVFRKKFFQLSDNYYGKKSSMLWDFLFYATFGITVVHSIEVGGILTIFGFLIIPASISALFSTSWTSRIITGWVIGTLVSAAGLYLSWTVDIPSAPTVILFLGVALVLALLFKTIQKHLFKKSEKAA